MFLKTIFVQFSKSTLRLSLHQNMILRFTVRLTLKVAMDKRSTIGSKKGKKERANFERKGEKNRSNVQITISIRFLKVILFPR